MIGRATSLLGVLLATGCGLGLGLDDLPASTRHCGKDPSDARLRVDPLLEPVSTDVTFTGGVDAESGIAIRRVTVAGVPATPVSFNFSSWTVTVPIGALRALPEDPSAECPPDGETRCVLAPVRAVDSCERAVAADLPAAVVRQAGTLTSLSLRVEAPRDDLSWIPADGTEPAVVAVAAPAGPDGVRVELAATIGDLAEDELFLRRSGDGSLAASTLLTVSSGETGTSIVTAQSGPLTAVAAIGAVTAPRFSPAGGTLSSGQRITVTAASPGGALERCQASSSPALDATLGEVDLEAETATDLGQASVEIVVLAQDEPASGAITLECSDPYGQRGTATFSVELP